MTIKWHTCLSQYLDNFSFPNTDEKESENETFLLVLKHSCILKIRKVWQQHVACSFFASDFPSTLSFQPIPAPWFRQTLHIPATFHFERIDAAQPLFFQTHFFGLGLDVPYYYPIDDYQDLTMIPKFSQKKNDEKCRGGKSTELYSFFTTLSLWITSNIITTMRLTVHTVNIIYET